MIAWLMANWGTILVSLCVVGLVALSVAILIHNKKQGKSSCGGSCAHCAMGGTCHGNQKRSNGSFG